MRKLEHAPEDSNANGGGVREHPVPSPAAATSQPAADRRVARAVFLDCVRQDDGTWLVTGGAQPHVVNAAVTSCDCPDHQLRGGSCKHLRRVQLALGDETALGQLRAVVTMPKRQPRRVAAP